MPFLNREQKAYTGTITLGRATDTLDSTGETTETAAVLPLTTERLEEAAKRFRGEIEQIPPMFSALKRSGVPLYKLARKGSSSSSTPARYASTHSRSPSLPTAHLRYRSVARRGPMFARLRATSRERSALSVTSRRSGVPNLVPSSCQTPYRSTGFRPRRRCRSSRRVRHCQACASSRPVNGSSARFASVSNGAWPGLRMPGLRVRPPRS